MQSAGTRLKIDVLGNPSQTRKINQINQIKSIYLLPVTKERSYLHYLAARPVSQTGSDPKYSVQVYN